MHRNNIAAAAIVITLLGLSLQAWADPTPPMMPVVVEAPLPPPVTLPPAEVAPADMPETPLTATEAALIALHHQPSIIVAQKGVTAAQARTQQTKAGLKPSLSVNGGYTDLAMVTSGQGGGGGSEGFSAGGSVKQLLYDYHHTRALVQQAAAQEQSAMAGLTRTQSDLVFQVKQAYYNYVQALRLISVNEANLRNRQDHLAQAQARVKAGVGLPIDVVRAETAVNEATLSLNLAQNSASVAKVTLAQLMGLDPRTPIKVAEEDEPLLAMDDFNALLAAALQQRPEIRQAQATLQATGFGINAARTSNLPVYSGTAGLNMRGTGLPTDNNNLTLGVAVQWSAYDGGLTKEKVKEAEANRDIAKAQFDAAMLTVQSDVSQAYLNERTAELRLTTADAEVANAQEAVRLAQGRYNAGLGTFLDVLDAQAALVTAQTNRVNTQSAINQSRAALAHAVNSDPALKQ